MLKYGFLDIEINDDLSNICDVIPRANTTVAIGSEQVIGGDTWRFLTRDLDTKDVRAGWHIGVLHREGTYGKIYRADRMLIRRRSDGRYNVEEAPHEVVLKQTLPHTNSSIVSREDVTAHTSEALLHILAWQHMITTHTPWAIPRPYEVFGDPSGNDGWRSMSFCMSYIRGCTFYTYLGRHWNPLTPRENTRLFLELIAQIAYILHQLQAHMRLNHRDLKLNNVLLRKRAAPVSITLNGTTLLTQYEVTLIDFGFACVGCPPPTKPITVFQAGSWFPLGELCCKVGRDIAQLLFCIHCYYPLETYLTPDVFAAMKACLQIPWSGGVADALHGFTKEGRPRRKGASGSLEYNTGIYEFLRRPDVDPVACEPARLFQMAVHGLAAL